jgi:hypothetical protein
MPRRVGRRPTDSARRTIGSVRVTLDKIKSWLRRAGDAAKDVAEGEQPASTPPPGSASSFGDDDRETSTNAQTEGAADEPWNS